MKAFQRMFKAKVLSWRFLYNQFIILEKAGLADFSVKQKNT